MKKYSWIILVGILPAWAAPAHGQLFSRKTKANPIQRVPALIVALKTETDDRKRANAADELGTFDSKAFPEIVPVLVEVVQSDAKANVRYEAVSSLAGLRPVSPAAGMALEKAASADDSWKVRWHAKSALVKYRLAGYSTPKGDGKGPSLGEPPLQGAKVEPKTTPTPSRFPPGTMVSRPATVGVPASPGSVKNGPPPIPRQLPQGPQFSTAVPQGPQVIRPPLPMTEQGPELIPLPPPPTTKRNPY